MKDDLIQQLLNPEPTPRIFDPSHESPITLSERTLIIPQELQNIGVIDDNFAESVEFVLPDSYDNVSWVDKIIVISWINAEEESGTVLVEKVQHQGAEILFSWDITNNITKYAGTVRFALTIKGEGDYRWNSEIAQFNVVNGLGVIGDMPPEHVMNRFEQWESRLTGMLTDLENMTEIVDGNDKKVNASMEKLEELTSTVTQKITDTETAITQATQATNRANQAATNTNAAIAAAEDATAKTNQSITNAQTATTNANNAANRVDTSINNANTATSKANEAAAKANTAASNVDSATARADKAVSDANTAITTANNTVDKANAAITNAQSAATKANTAATNADNATAAANRATNSANTATTNANNAASRTETVITNANTAISNTNAAIDKANQAANNANTSASRVETAVTNANQALKDANSAIDRANQAWNNVQKEPITEDNYLNGIRYIGSSFHGNCSRAGIEVMRIQGKTTQETTLGYQLFDASRIDTVIKKEFKLYNNKDGSFSAFGRNYAGGPSYTLDVSEFRELFKQKPLKTISYPTVRPYFYGQLQGANQTVINTVRSSKPNEINIDENDYNRTLAFNSGTKISESENPNMRDFKPMLYQDGDGTWERFSGGKPAPNPDYPMPLKSFEANKISCIGKNVAVISDKTYVLGGTVDQLEDGTIIVKNVTGGTNTITASYSVNHYAGGDGHEWDERFNNLVRIPDDAQRIYIKSFEEKLDKIIIEFYDKHKHSLGYDFVKGTSVDLGRRRGAEFICVGIQVVDSHANQTIVDRLMVSFEPITEYVPPHFEEIELPEPLILHGLPDGTCDEYLGDGKIIRRCKEITIDASGMGKSFNRDKVIYLYNLTDAPKKISYNLLCSWALGNGEIKEGSVSLYFQEGWNMTQIILYAPDRITTLEEATEFAKGKNLEFIYQLEVPTFEQYPMPILPSWDDTCRAFFVSETETEIEWRPCPISDNTKQVQDLREELKALKNPSRYRR